MCMMSILLSNGDPLLKCSAQCFTREKCSSLLKPEHVYILRVINVTVYQINQ